MLDLEDEAVDLVGRRTFYGHSSGRDRIPASEALRQTASVESGTFLAQKGHEVVNPPLPDEDFDEAVKIAQAEFDRHQPDVIVGSSRGGAVATG